MDRLTITVTVGLGRSTSGRLYLGFLISNGQPCRSKAGRHFIIWRRSLKTVFHKVLVLLPHPGKEGSACLCIHGEPRSPNQRYRHQKTRSSTEIFVGHWMAPPPDGTLHFALKPRGKLMVTIFRTRQRITDGLISLRCGNSQHFFGDHNLPSFSYRTLNRLLARWSSFDAAERDSPRIAATSFTLYPWK